MKILIVKGVIMDIVVKRNKNLKKIALYIRKARYDKSALAFILMFAFSFIYSFVWSKLTLDRFFSLNQPVADLGSAMELVWITTHNTFSVYQAFQNILYSSGPYYIFWASYFKNPEIFLLIFQSTFLGFSAIPIYLISRLEIGTKTESILIGCAYLFYFPLSGINWFAFHFQAMFIPLFLTGYYFYKRDKTKLSIFLFILAGFVKFPFFILILLFSFIESVRYMHKLKEDERVDYFARKLWSLIFLSIISTVFLLLGYFIIIHNNTTVQTYLHIPNGTSLIYLQSSYSKFVTILLVFSPFFFLPFLSKKWLLLYFPFIFLVIYSNNSSYVFPVLFQSQYTSVIIPFLFLGLIDVLRNFPHTNTNDKQFSISNKKIVNHQEIIISRKKLVFAIFALTLIFAIFYQPYGPLNPYNPDNFNLVGQTQYNVTRYNYFEDEINLIPISCPYVLMQNNMPELLPRELSYNFTILNVGLTPFAPNLSIGEVINNSFPREIVGNKWIDVKIVYAMGDAFTPNYFFAGYPGSPSMYCFLKVLYNSSLYGIYAQEGSVILLKRGYTGYPVLYSPFNIYYSMNSLCNLVSNYTENNNTLTYSNISYHSLFRTSDVFYPPGRYNLTISLKSSSYSNENNLSLGIVRQGQSGNWRAFNITSRDFSKKNGVNKITFQFTINDFYKFLYFELYLNKWVGEVTVLSLGLNEINPI